jgi:hypothetical protein
VPEILPTIGPDSTQNNDHKTVSQLSVTATRYFSVSLAFIPKPKINQSKPFTHLYFVQVPGTVPSNCAILKTSQLNILNTSVGTAPKPAFPLRSLCGENPLQQQHYYEKLKSIAAAAEKSLQQQQQRLRFYPSALCFSPSLMVLKIAKCVTLCTPFIIKTILG